MPRVLSVFTNKNILFCTSRLEEGLLLLPYSFINAIILCSLGLAWKKAKVDLIALFFSANHFHIILRVINPEDVPEFFKYLKQEISHRVNRLLGRSKKTNWEEGYDKPVILDGECAIEKLVYLFTNPVKDGLSETVEEYPGITSYGKTEFECKIFSRNSVPVLEDPERPWLEEKDVEQYISSRVVETVIVPVNVMILKEEFWPEMSDEEFLNMVERRVSEMVAAMEKVERKNLKQSLLTRYIPAKRGRRSAFITKCSELRKRFLEFYRWMKAQFKQGVRLIRENLEISFPPGVYTVSPPRTANFISWQAFVTGYS